MLEIKELLATLVASQTSLPTPEETPIPTVESVEPRTSPTRNTPKTVRLPPLQNTRSPSIPRSNSEDPPHRHKKSTISERITPLSDGIEHTFLQWSASIRDRLVVNEDHYPTDVSRRALIWGTTTGLAKTYLEPRYLSATHGFRSANEMMDLLGWYYLTGNETERARDLFDNLQMGEKGHATETFLEFKARFQSAAIIGQVTNHVMVMKSLWKGNYQNMVRGLSAYDLEWRRNNELDPALIPTEQTVTIVT
ncbi:hypothetical protein V500_02153 [Pseudogymnoascus sp. VKM F-4518 (FW-2643)]|nr:hypothetical protein V500_02153 [Pseudogymnoascus sp. VKM F-4518 (FW-2643)]